MRLRRVLDGTGGWDYTNLSTSQRKPLERLAGRCISDTAVTIGNGGSFAAAEAALGPYPRVRAAVESRSAPPLSIQERVFIAGAGPVGLVAAANLLRHGVPVTVFEAGSELSRESRASTFHPPTLDMLGELGAAQELIAQGLSAPRFQYRSRADGVLAQFDFGAIADATRHPYRVQCEQSKLTQILYGGLRDNASFRLQFGSRVQDVAEDGGGIHVSVEAGGQLKTHSGRFLIGADGARSEVRRSLGIEFAGFTWPERFLVVSTPFDFHAVIPDLVAVNYVVADAARWHFLLQIPGLWRIMFPIAENETDELALSHAFAQTLMAGIVPGVTHYDIAHLTLY